MKNFAKTAALAILMAAAVPFSFAAGEEQGSKADVSVAKPAAVDAPSEELPPLTEKVARLAAILSVAFDRLPDATCDQEKSRVIWALSGKFNIPGIRYDRYSAFMQIDGRTFAGVDFASQNGAAITMQGFEMETPEPGSAAFKIKVVEKDASSTNFFVFDRAEIEKDAAKALKDLKSAPLPE